MTTTDDTTTTTDPTTEPAAGPATAPDGAAPEGDQQAEDRPGAEAAKYRRRLREAESERDALAGRVEAMQRAEAVRLAGEHLADGEDIFALTNAAVADVIDDDGAVDAAKVRAAAKALIADRGERFARPPAPVVSFGGGARPLLRGEDSDTTWHNALQGR